jgi:hypothetical protein
VTPVFDPDTLDYTGNTRDPAFTLAYTTESETASVEARLNNALVTTGANTWQDGNNLLELTVTDGPEEAIYSIQVNYVPVSTQLTALTTSPTTLSPAFSPTTTSYTGATNSVGFTLAYTAQSELATVGVTLNGTAVSAGSNSWVPGSNTLVLTVTDNGESATYTVTVTYTVPDPRMSNIIFGGSGISNLSPTFSSDNYGPYTCDSSTDISWSVRVFKIDSATVDTYTLNGTTVVSPTWGTLNPGPNTLIVHCDNNGITCEYTYTITYTP